MPVSRDLAASEMIPSMAVAELLALLGELSGAESRLAACRLLCRGLADHLGASDARWLRADAPQTRSAAVAIQADPRVLVMRLQPPNQPPLGRLRLQRGHPWTHDDVVLLDTVAGAYAAVLARLPEDAPPAPAALADLAGGVAHGCNNLLQTIVGYASLGIAQGVAEPVVLGYLKETETAGHEMADLLSNLMAYARSGPRRPEILTVDRVVQEALQPRSGVPNLELALGGGEAAIRGDRLLVRRAVTNLVDNAIEAAGLERPVRLETEVVQLAECAADAGFVPAPGRYYRLRVADHGPGVRPDLIPSLFRPFVSTNGLGRGLGLAAVAGICRSHGGGVTLRSSPAGTEVDAFFGLHDTAE